MFVPTPIVNVLSRRVHEMPEHLGLGLGRGNNTPHRHSPLELESRPIELSAPRRAVLRRKSRRRRALSARRDGHRAGLSRHRRGLLRRPDTSGFARRSAKSRRSDGRNRGSVARRRVHRPPAPGNAQPAGLHRRLCLLHRPVYVVQPARDAAGSPAGGLWGLFPARGPLRSAADPGVIWRIAAWRKR